MRSDAIRQPCRTLHDMAEVEVSERAPQVTFRLSPAAVAAVDRVAAREGRTRSQVVRSAVVELLERRGEFVGSG